MNEISIIKLNQLELSSFVQNSLPPSHAVIIEGDDEDFGGIHAACYRVTLRYGNGRLKSIDFSSLDLTRSHKVDLWIRDTLTDYLLNRIGGVSVIARIRYFVAFVFWCDSNGFAELFISDHNYHSALTAYKKYLRDLYAAGRSESSIKAKFVAAAHGGAIVFPNSIVKFDINLEFLKGGVTAGKLLEERGLSGIEVALDYNYSVFRGLAHHLLARKKFPFRLKLPTEQVWVLPKIKYFLKSEKHKTVNHPFLFKQRAWDFSKGIPDLEYLNGSGLSSLKKRVLAQANAANADSKHPIRMNLAKLAHDAFLFVFVTITGINESDVRKLPWDEKYVIEKTRKGFKTVKSRAGDLIVEYEITNEFEDDLLIFFKLRNFIVAANQHSYLFVGMGKELAGNITKLKKNCLQTHANRMCAYVNPDLIEVSYQALRLYKSMKLVENHPEDADIIPELMNHSPKVFRRHYLAASIDMAEEQMTLFFVELSMAKQKFLDLNKTPAGLCADVNQPKVNNKELKLTPDCNDFLGCLNCANFAVHADEVDIRKILSMSFVIDTLKVYSNSITLYEATFAVLKNKIDALLDDIAGDGAERLELVQRIRVEVYVEEKLTAYWAHKLMYISGVFTDAV